MDDEQMEPQGQGSLPHHVGVNAHPQVQPPVVAQLTKQQMIQLVQYAAQGSMQTIQNMHMASTQQFVQLQDTQLELQGQVFERLANPPTADPLKKLLETDPQFPVFSGQSQDLLRWVLECQD